ncbi:S8 family peptidase [Hugenholtzia roseola]|uniref:S8 family peptidase n=1 Tax=Hugenholtzia roseola TaxID=1002 RepID=UPI00041C038C|nr:S8 family serine peptidase [Hugenholtzia roseola]
MASWLYPLAYLGMLASAAIWFYFKEREQSLRFTRHTFGVSLLLYILSLFINEGGVLYDLLGVLTPDMAILVVTVLILNRYAPRPKMIYFMVFAILAGLKLFFLDPVKEKAIHYVFNSPAEICTAEGELYRSTQKEKALAQNLAQEGELLVLLENENNLTADIATLTEVLKPFQAEVRLAFASVKSKSETRLDEYALVDIPTQHLADIETIKKLIEETGLVADIENNEILKLDLPSSSNYKVTKNPNYGVNDPDVKNLWAFEAMEIDKLYQILRNTTPKKKAKVFILDTGVEADHEDLSDQYASVEAGYDYDKLGHGTHCAGIAGAVSNNGKGIASVALNQNFFTITSIKVLSDSGYGSQETVIAGIIRAVDEGADVISLSLGGPSDDDYQKAYLEAVAYAEKSGAILVVAAGNSNENAKYFSPANVEGVITVAAVDAELNKADFSNTVEDLKMGIAAPGVQIYSTFPNGTYRYLSGTSMATPYVAGIIGLAKALKPDLTAKEAHALLQGSGKELAESEKVGIFVQPAQMIADLKD